MARVVKRYFRFAYPEVESVIAFNLYSEAAPFDFDAAFASGNPPAPKRTIPKVDLPVVDGKYSIDLVAALGGTPDGAYDLAVTAVEVSGNESDPLEIENVPLDVTPPPAPTDGEIVEE